MTADDAHPERPGLAVTLDGERIEQLRLMAEDDLVGILDEVARDLGASVDAARAALDANDFGALFQAAHSGRNVALIVGARDLLGALAQLTRAALASEESAAQDAMERTVAVWPATRIAIEHLRGSP